MKTNSDRRRDFAKQRIGRLTRLRAMHAPKWIIKSEQVALVMNRRGLKYDILNPSKSQEKLMHYVHAALDEVCA